MCLPSDFKVNNFHVPFEFHYFSDFRLIQLKIHLMGFWGFGGVAGGNFEVLRAVLELAERNYRNLSVIKGDCQFRAFLTESESFYIRRMIKNYLVA